MKKTWMRPAAAVLAAAMLGGALPASAVSANDITNHWAQSSIQKWLDAGKISGYPDGSFHPNQSMTRAEFAALLSGVVKNKTTDEAAKNSFTDVAENQWFYAPIMKLLQNGVVAAGENFRPNDPITRQEVMTMVARAYSIVSFDESVLEQFTDASQIAEYAKLSVAGFIDYGYISGYPDKTLRPQAKITRAECVKMLDNLNLVHEAGSLEDVMDRLYDGISDLAMPSVEYTRITDETANFYLGLSNLDGISEALAAEPMISSVAHSICLVRVKDGTDADNMMETIRTSVNPHKWICVGVDSENVKVARQGNLIILVMDNEVSQQVIDRFHKMDFSEKLKPDTNGLLSYDGWYMDDIGELRPDSIVRFSNKVESLTSSYLQGASSISYAIVPSKSYFVNDKLATPFDYSKMNQLLQDNIQSASAIDLTGALELFDYCKTDPHWKQENLQSVLDKLGEKMNFSVDLSKFTAHKVENFTGQHGAGKSGFSSETLHYLTDAAIDSATVSNFQNPNKTTVYDVDALQSDTPYNLFLSGPTPLLTITSPDATTDRELVIFRDSFACSLAPLLADTYKTITLVDLRYMSSSLLPQYVDFKDKDVLFLYNEQVINHSEMLR